MIKLNTLGNILSIFAILICSQSQRYRRMVTESSTALAAGNNNLSTTRNDVIVSAINNLKQALSVNQKYIYTFSHAPFLYPFASAKHFNLSSHTRPTSFQLACASLDVTWGIDVIKLPPFFIAIKTRVKEIHWDNGTTGITNIRGRICLTIIRSNFKLTSLLSRMPTLMCRIIL